MQKQGPHAFSLLDIVQAISFDYCNNSIKIFGETFNHVSSQDINALGAWLYGALHTGNTQLVDPLEAIKDEGFRTEIINNTPDPGNPLVLQPYKKLGQTLVDVEGVSVAVTASDTQTPVSLSFSCLRPYLTPGFVMFQRVQNNQDNDAKHRLYVSCPDATFGFQFWKKLIPELLDTQLSFQTKILCHRASYPRNDAIVVYTDEKASNEQALDIICNINDHLRDNEQEVSTSLLAMKVANGLSYAHDPIQVSVDIKSFGQHRTEAIALAIKDHFQTYIPFNELLHGRCIQHNINPNNFAKNLALGDLK